MLGNLVRRLGAILVVGALLISLTVMAGLGAALIVYLLSLVVP